MQPLTKNQANEYRLFGACMKEPEDANDADGWASCYLDRAYKQIYREQSLHKIRQNRNGLVCTGFTQKWWIKSGHRILGR